MTPDPLMKTAHGYIGAKRLFVAHEIGLFEKLSARLRGGGALERRKSHRLQTFHDHAPLAGATSLVVAEVVD